jgi:zinc transport system ATP-binding protein
MAAEALIEVRGLALGYGAAPVLRDVELTVRRGDVWFLIGPNGSGKSTFLRAVLGLLRPLRGTLSLHPDAADRARVGFVPQRCDWNPALPTTVREFVSLGMVGARVPEAERGARLRFALARAALEGLERADYRALSGGQRQRALVARALVRRPALLVLDEPTEELDVVSEAGLLDTLAELVRGEGTTVLFVTHELDLAAQRATHVALFEAGGVVAGTRDEVVASPAFARAFGRGRRVGGHA